MPTNSYEEGFPDNDPTDELPVLTDVIAERDADKTAVFRRPSDDEDTGTFAASSAEQIPTLAERDERAAGLERVVADRDAHLKTLEAELANLEQRWRTTSAELTTRNEELAEARDELERRSAELATNRRALEDAASKNAQLDQKITELQAALASAENASAALEDNARALEQQIVELEAAQATSISEAQSVAENGRVGKLKEEIATLGQHIENRNTIWRRQAAEVAERSTRVRELELELAQRVQAQRAAERLAEIEVRRSQDLQERLAASLAAPSTTVVTTDRAPEAERATVTPDATDRPQAEQLGAELMRAVALQANAGGDSDALRRLEGLEMAIRDLEKDMDSTGTGTVEMPVPDPQPELICLTDEDSEVFHLDSGETVIGRGSHCAVRIMTHYVSREHACIRRSRDACTIEDLGSRNGVYVNSVRIDRRELKNDDLITIGDTQFRFRAPGGSRA